MSNKSKLVTLSASPTLELAKYEFLKPSATIQVDIGGPNPEAALAAGRIELKKLLYHAALTELTFRDELEQALAKDSSLESLTEFVVEKLNVNAKCEEVGTEEETIPTKSPKRQAKRSKATT